MRKIIAIVLAVVMIAAMSIPAFAAELKDDTPTDVPVTYAPAKGYVVIIPAEFVLEELDDQPGVASGEDTVTIQSAKLNHGEVLTVTVKSKSNNTNMIDDYNWKLVEETDSNSEIGYKIAVSDATNEEGYTNGEEESITATDLEQDTAVIAYKSSSAQWKQRVSKMVLTTAYSNKAGTFKDLLTFTASVD